MRSQSVSAIHWQPSVARVTLQLHCTEAPFDVPVYVHVKVSQCSSDAGEVPSAGPLPDAGRTSAVVTAVASASRFEGTIWSAP